MLRKTGLFTVLSAVLLTACALGESAVLADDEALLVDQRSGSVEIIQLTDDLGPRTPIAVDDIVVIVDINNTENVPDQIQPVPEPTGGVEIVVARVDAPFLLDSVDTWIDADAGALVAVSETGERQEWPIE